MEEVRLPAVRCSEVEMRTAPRFQKAARAQIGIVAAVVDIGPKRPRIRGRPIAGRCAPRVTNGAEKLKSKPISHGSSARASNHSATASRDQARPGGVTIMGAVLPERHSATWIPGCVVPCAPDQSIATNPLKRSGAIVIIAVLRCATTLVPPRHPLGDPLLQPAPGRLVEALRRQFVGPVVRARKPPSASWSY